MAFVYRFEGKHPEVSYEERAASISSQHRRGRNSGPKAVDGQKPFPPLLSGIAFAIGEVRKIEEVQSLPQTNRNMLSKMTEFMMRIVNSSVGKNRWGENFWGLYIVGSRANGTALPFSDLDLLSAGTFGRDLSFTDGYAGENIGSYSSNGVFRGFSGAIPAEISVRYDGTTSEEYRISATPQEPDAVPVNLNVVALPAEGANTLDSFKADQDSKPIVRLPLVELSVPTAPQTVPLRFERRHFYY